MSIQKVQGVNVEYAKTLDLYLLSASISFSLCLLTACCQIKLSRYVSWLLYNSRMSTDVVLSDKQGQRRENDSFLNEKCQDEEALLIWSLYKLPAFSFNSVVHQKLW